MLENVRIGLLADFTLKLFPVVADNIVTYTLHVSLRLQPVFEAEEMD